MVMAYPILLTPHIAMSLYHSENFIFEMKNDGSKENKKTHTTARIRPKGIYFTDGKIIPKRITINQKLFVKYLRDFSWKADFS